MPSFDIVSKINQHEITNAVDQTNRELNSRFDFKGTNARLEQAKNKITLFAPTDFQLKQVNEIFLGKLAKRQIDARTLDYKNVNVAINEARQEVDVREGIDMELAKKITGMIKNAKFKVQASIQENQVRVTGKKRDDLQEVMAMLREVKLSMPLQFENFRE